MIIDNNGRITATNYSKIATDVRFKITYDTPASNTPITYNPANTGDLEVTLGTDFVGTYNGGFFEATFAAPTNVSEEIVLISYLGYADAPESSGSQSAYINFEGNVHVLVQAKQHDYADWTDIWST